MKETPGAGSMAAGDKTVVLEMGGEITPGMETAVKGTLAAIFYGVCSVSIVVVNKLLMDYYEFDFPVIILVGQMIMAIMVLEILRLARLTSVPRYTIRRGLSFALPALFYGINAYLALTALSHMNIAMYGVLKRCVPLSTLIFSCFMFKKKFPSKHVIGSIMLLTVGCFIAGYGDLTFNLKAYAFGFLSNFTQALYLLLVQRYSEGETSSVETLELNSINTLPLLIVFAFINGEIFEVGEYKYFNEPRFVFLFLLAISMGCLLNYSLFLCTELTSALTTSVVGGLKALGQTLLGLFTFGGVSHNLPTYIGITMNLTGGISYIYTKYSENRHHAGHTLKKILSFSRLDKAQEEANELAKVDSPIANGVVHMSRKGSSSS